MLRWHGLPCCIFRILEGCKINYKRIWTKNWSGMISCQCVNKNRYVTINTITRMAVLTRHEYIGGQVFYMGKKVSVPIHWLSIHSLNVKHTTCHHLSGNASRKVIFHHRRFACSIFSCFYWLSCRWFDSILLSNTIFCLGETFSKEVQVIITSSFWWYMVSLAHDLLYLGNLDSCWWMSIIWKQVPCYWILHA